MHLKKADLQNLSASGWRQCHRRPLVFVGAPISYHPKVWGKWTRRDFVRVWSGGWLYFGVICGMSRCGLLRVMLRRAPVAVVASAIATTDARERRELMSAMSAEDRAAILAELLAR